jgi:hypothetical protein
MRNISRLPPTPINAKVRHDANVKTAQLDIAVAGVVRELLTAWTKGDPRAEAIIKEAIARGAFVRGGPGKRIE